jgi:DeoR/GlpR family transcriptional regulator of sugar metabolism
MAEPTAAALPAAARRRRILEQIEREGGAQVATLARAFAVSTITIHRDLEHLAASGLVERVRGGVTTLPGSRPVETDFVKRSRRAQAEKRAIAVEAAALLGEAQTIFLDASTTVLALARELERLAPAGLTIVTNSPAIAYELQAPPIHVIVVPGELDQQLRAIGGAWAVEFVSALSIELAFVSGVGLTPEHGLTTSQRAIADLLRAVRAVSAHSVALVDSTKVGVHSLLPIAALDELDEVVVDAAIAPGAEQALRAGGGVLRVAGRD